MNVGSQKMGQQTFLCVCKDLSDKSLFASETKHVQFSLWGKPTCKQFRSMYESFWRVFIEQTLDNFPKVCKSHKEYEESVKNALVSKLLDHFPESQQLEWCLAITDFSSLWQNGYFIEKWFLHLKLSKFHCLSREVFLWASFNL